MKTDFNKIECDILLALSDFLPHNQNQIADLIGNNHKKSTDRVHVSRCLENLKTYLDRAPNDLDELGKKWVLKQDIQTLRQITEKYPSLISDLQKNDKFLSILIEKHSWIFKLPKLIPERRLIVETPGHEIPRPEYELNDDWEAMPSKPDKELNEAYLLEAEAKLKLKLELSPDFFKICILNDPDNLKDIFDEIFWQTKEGQFYEFIRESILEEQNIISELFPPSPRNNPADNFYPKCSDIIFESCVHHDILTGYKNTEAVDYLKKMIKDDMLKEIGEYP